MNLDLVRKYFPGLSSEWTFMDNAGGSQILKPVVDRISDYLINTNVQLGASYHISKLATERVAKAPKMLAQFINAKDESQIVIGSSTTMLLRILAICIGQNFNPGDEIIVSNSDHEANIGAWVDLEKQGLIVKFWKVNKDTFRMELEDLKILMTDKTKLVAVTHTSNILGTLNPIKEYAKFVHSYGALICVDGVAHTPHRLIDVQDSDVDFYAFSLYKVYGPHIAMLYGKKELLLNLPGINHYFIEKNQIPYKLQPGSVNYELSYGSLGIQDYFNSLSQDLNFQSSSFRNNAKLCFELFANHEEVLAEKLLSFLNTKPNVKIIGERSFSKEVRVPTISFVVDGKRSDSITEKVDEYKIGIRYGDFYARRLIEYLGLSNQNGVVRVSLVHYNTIEEVEKLIKVFDKLL